MYFFEIFREFMDQLFFPGYTDEILVPDQELFNFEYEQFLKNYA